MFLLPRLVLSSNLADRSAPLNCFPALQRGIRLVICLPLTFPAISDLSEVERSQKLPNLPSSIIQPFASSSGKMDRKHSNHSHPIYRAACEHSGSLRRQRSEKSSNSLYNRIIIQVWLLSMENEAGRDYCMQVVRLIGLFL
jgi:hypothetical protein